jgi:hypothetical protein
MKSEKSRPASRPGCGRVAAAAAGLVILVLVGGYVVATQFPEAGANAAMGLRRLIGDQAVAQLEMAVYAIEDTLHQWEARVGLSQASTPWAELPTQARQPTLVNTATAPAITPTATPTPTASPQATASGPTLPPATAEPATPTPTPTMPWSLTPLAPYTSMKDEGQWQGYIQDGSGQTVVYRTRLFPDRKRLYYAEAIVVAFNLDATRLHFVLGKDEPKASLSVKIDRPGKIPSEDLKIGRLLAAFNGGFLAEHGAFGAMAQGVTILPPREGLATVAIYDDGHIKLGAWGRDIITDTHIVAWRQNGPLLIDNGQINPQTTVGLPRDWGYSVGGETVIWRSALGLSADRRTLYYVAGPNLTLPMLASAVAATGAQYAMQLDINDYWVFFCTFYPNEQDPGHIETWALHQVMRYKNRDRYLNGFERDFFYVTSATN